MIFMMGLLISLLLLNFIKKSKNILLFLLNLEMGLIILAFLVSILMKMYFMIILMIGVLEAILGLTFLITFIRFYGNDNIYFM